MGKLTERIKVCPSDGKRHRCEKGHRYAFLATGLLMAGLCESSGRGSGTAVALGLHFLLSAVLSALPLIAGAGGGGGGECQGVGGVVTGGSVLEGLCSFPSVLKVFPYFKSGRQ